LFSNRTFDAVGHHQAQLNHVPVEAELFDLWILLCADFDVMQYTVVEDQSRAIVAVGYVWGDGDDG
jgi:hypothetical protein